MFGFAARYEDYKMKKKVILIPLDERPCNYDFPRKLFCGGDMELVLPPKSLLGDKKSPADTEGLISFLTDNIKGADGAVISAEMLLYGGLLPSRLHYLSKEQTDARLSVLRRLKQDNPALELYVFSLIMRCPEYASSEEEPDYYEVCGDQIHHYGAIKHKRSLGLMTEEEVAAELGRLDRLDYTALEDYTCRREFNTDNNLKVLDLLSEHVIDFLVIPQDDSAKYGFTAIDQRKVREKIKSDNLAFRAYMYPGADEVAMVLLTRMLNNFKRQKPRVYVRYSAVGADKVIPAYEDRSLGETLKYQILAAGCKQVFADEQADLVLGITAPSHGMREAKGQEVPDINYDVERNLTEFVTAVNDYIEEGVPVAIGDNAYANGGDLELIRLLNTSGLLMNLAAYAGWNTSSNTIGTALSQGIAYIYYGDTKEHYDFLVERYLEDAGYCSVVRRRIAEQDLSRLKLGYFNVAESNGEVSRLAEKYLRQFADIYLNTITNNVIINSTGMPWRRMFEIALDASYDKSEKHG